MTIDLQNELRIRDKKLSISKAKNAELVQSNIELKESNYELVEALKIILTQCQDGEGFTFAVEGQAMQALTNAKKLTK